jgi:tetratricopeptide (TPR) repeat protein
MRRKLLKLVEGFSIDEDEASNYDISINGVNDVQEIEKLTEEGCSFAETGNFGTALKIWNTIKPCSFIIHEMKAQAYLNIDSLISAAKEAAMAIELNPSWSCGYHTLARVQREMGELDLSIENYKCAKSIDPSNAEICDELIEVENLRNQMIDKRNFLRRNVDISNTDEAKEANLCIYHLSSRLKTVFDTDANIMKEV